MRKDKWTRATKNYNGHRGSATIGHVERNLLSVYPTAKTELTGAQYGKVMSVANDSYLDGKSDQEIDIWAYDDVYNFMAGLGVAVPDNNGGYRNPGIIKVDGDTITITDTNTGTDKIYKLQK